MQGRCLLRILDDLIKPYCNRLKDDIAYFLAKVCLKKSLVEGSCKGDES
jgi:hypothetical protein